MDKKEIVLRGLESAKRDLYDLGKLNRYSVINIINALIYLVEREEKQNDKI